MSNYEKDPNCPSSVSKTPDDVSGFGIRYIPFYACYAEHLRDMPMEKAVPYMKELRENHKTYDADTVAEQLAYADGGIVGSYFKYNGDAYGYMDEDRVKQFMENTNQLVFYDQIIIQSLPQIISWIQKDNTTVLFRVLEMSEDERETWLKNVLSSLSSEQKQEIIKWLFELNNLNLCDLPNT